MQYLSYFLVPPPHSFVLPHRQAGVSTQQTLPSTKMARPRRNFNPNKSKRYGFETFTPDKLVKYSPTHEVARLMNFPFRGSHWRPQMRSVVIGIDGACSVNNRQDPNSRAAYGVFFGPNCQYNKCGFLKSYAVQSSNRAELEAVRQALRIVQSRRNSGEFDSWRQIILKTDSEYVANTLSEWVWGWQEKGWVRSKGKAIEHLDLIQELHSTIGEIEAWGAVRFWRVGREWNEDADALAKHPLKSAGYAPTQQEDALAEMLRNCSIVTG